MSRKDRRANPDQWWKLVGIAGRMPEDLPEQFTQYAKGMIDDIVVIQIPEGLSHDETAALLRGIKETIALSGIEHQFMVIPPHVKMLRLRPVDHEIGKKLDRELSLRRLAQRPGNPGSGEPS